MTYSKKSYCKKSVALFLIAVIISPATILVLFPLKTAQAQCGTVEIASKDVKTQTWIQRAYYAVTKAYQSEGLIKAAITAGKLVWDTAVQQATHMASLFFNMLLHKLLARITNDLVNWIQNGGKPRFLSEGIGKYLLDAADAAGVDFLDQYLGAGWLCEPFDMNIKIALLETKKFEEKSRCTFDDIGHNLRDFYEDFTKGGWLGWLKVTEPQNNFYGELLMAKDEYNRVKTEAEENADKEAAMGKGFLSVQECAWHDARKREVQGFTDTVGQPRLPVACQPLDVPDPRNPGLTKGGFQGPCEATCHQRLPGSVVSEMVNEATTQGYKEVQSFIAGTAAKTGPFNPYISAVLNALFNRAVKEGLAFMGKLYEPDNDDVGAESEMPVILSSEKVLQNKDNVKLLSRNLATLKKNIQDDFLEEQKENAAVLTRIQGVYNETIPILNDVVTNCSGLSGRISFTSADTYQGYLTWAQEKIAEINSTTPALDQRINEMALKISNTTNLINNISETENLALNYTIQADNWLTVYEKVKGEEGNPELNNAELTLKTAETDLIKKTQEVIQGINNAVASADIEGLSQEIQESITTIVIATTNLQTQRGDASWPEAGTLYGELDEAGALKSTANTRNAQCLNAHSSSSGSSLP